MSDALSPEEAAILRALLAKDRTPRGVRCIVGCSVFGVRLRLAALAARGLVETSTLATRWRLTPEGRSAALAAATQGETQGGAS